MSNATIIGCMKGKNYSVTHCSSNCLITIERGIPSKAAFSVAASHRSSGILTLLILPPTENFLSELFDSFRVDFDGFSWLVIGRGYLFKAPSYSRQTVVNKHIFFQIVECITNVFTNVLHIRGFKSFIPILVAA